MIDLSKIIATYTNKWIALTPDNKKVVASGETLVQVLNISRKKGIENPSVMKVPKIEASFVG